MQFKSLIKKIILSVFLLVLFILEIPGLHTAHAASLRFYNYTSGTYENYTDKQVIYQLNGREVPLSYPGILVNGTALADYEELFVQELGLQANLSGDILTLTDGLTELVLTFGKTNVQLNGEVAKLNVAPVKLSFTDEEKYYVPTRYVAEAFGYDYVWNSSTSTVKITRTIPLTIDSMPVSYNGNLYTFCFQNERYYTDMPLIYYNGNVLAPVIQFSELLGCRYNENEAGIQITKNQLTLSIPANSKVTYINEKKIIAELLPIIVTDEALGKMEWYVSLEFITDLLGFKFNYSEQEKCYYITEDELTGSTQLYPELSETTEYNNIDAFDFTKQEIYFDWYAEEVSETEAETAELTRVLAYATELGDVIELYGISRNNINDFYDNGLAVFEFHDVYTNIKSEFFSHFTASRIDYMLLSALTNTNIKLFCMLPEEDTWSIIEKENCLQIIFTNSDANIDFVVNSEIKSQYPDDKLIIPLEESIPMEFISDEDNYINREFKIKLLGDYEDFYENNPIINPYYVIKEYTVEYDVENFQTIITFKTNSICGYKYLKENDYLEVSIGKPNEIYDKIIVLDAGHGGIDPGASKKGFNEKDINFKIINTYTKDAFAKTDVKVYFTRESDIKVDLYERAAFASEVGAELFISLHLNSNNKSSINGTEVYYYKENTSVSKNGINSYQLAKSLVNNLSSSLGTKNRGVIHADFVVVKYNTVPAVLIELGYMTNSSDLTKITSAEYQKKTAKTIVQTVLELLE